MIILIDARFYGLENTGPGRYTMNLIRELQKLDTRNEYLILLKRKYYESLQLSNNFKKILCDIPHYSFEEQVKLPEIIRKHNPDLTHFLFFNAPLSFNGNFVVTIHDMTMHKQKSESTNLFLPIYYVKHFVYKKVFKHAVLKSRKIIVPSEFVKDELLKNFEITGKKVDVIYEGVETLGRGNGQIDYPDLYFLYVGNAYPHKNLARAIEAIVKLNDSLEKKIFFYIVSSRNKFTNKLERLVKRLKARDYVKLLGFIPDFNLHELYEKSVGFIYPSLTEGFGLPGLEAMKAGTILLASDIPVFREIYGHHAIYFNPVEIISIEKAMKGTLGLSRIEAAKMIKDNKAFVKRYSWEKMTKETLEVYNTFK